VSASSVAGLGGLIHVMAQHHARRGLRCSHARSNELRGRYGRHCRPLSLRVPVGARVTLRQRIARGQAAVGAQTCRRRCGSVRWLTGSSTRSSRYQP